MQGVEKGWVVCKRGPEDNLDELRGRAFYTSSGCVRRVRDDCLSNLDILFLSSVSLERDGEGLTLQARTYVKRERSAGTLSIVWCVDELRLKRVLQSR